MNWELLTQNLIQSVVFTALGLVIFALAFWVIEVLTPANVLKKITEENNVAVAVVLGALFIAVALVIAAAIKG